MKDLLRTTDRRFGIRNAESPDPGSDRMRQVFVRHVFRYFLGRNEPPGDAVSLQEAEKACIEGGGSFQALLVSLLSSESFLYRSTPVETSRR